MILSLLLASSAFAQDIPSARVVLPWSDFERIYEKAHEAEPDDPAAPRPWALSRADYTGVVEADDDSAVFDARIQVDVLSDDGWVMVPLLPTSVGLSSAKIGGKDAPIVLNGGWYTLVTDRQGSFSVDLEFAASVFEGDGTWTLAFPLAPSGGTEVELLVPSASPLEFTVPQATLLRDDQPRPNQRRLEAVLPATSSLSVSWQRAAEEEEAVVEDGEGRLYAEVHTLVGVSEGVLQGQSEVNWTIVRQGVDALSVGLPADVAVLDLRGAGVREWEVVRDGELQRIDVALNFEALGSYRLTVDYERPLGDGSLVTDVPELTVPGVERVKGLIGVEARSNLEIQSGEASGATRLDVRELPASVLGRTDQPVLLGFKVRSNEWEIPLEVAQHEDVDVLVTIADTAEATTMMTADGRIMGQVAWNVRNNRRQFLRLDMPEGGEIWSVRVADRAVKPAVDDQGQVLIPLVRSQASEGALAAFTVEVVWVQDGEAPDEKGSGVAAFSLPRVDVPVTYLKWRAYMPSEARIKKKDVTSTLRQVEWFSEPVTLEGEYLSMASQAQAQVASSYAAQEAANESGVEPIEVSMPVGGTATLFEKLLVVDEPLEATIAYKKLK